MTKGHINLSDFQFYYKRKPYLCSIKNKPMADKELNRLKVLLVEKKRTGKWLAEQLGKDQTTISKWCTNCNQPDVESLIKIAKLLEVNINDILITD